VKQRAKSKLVLKREGGSKNPGGLGNSLTEPGFGIVRGGKINLKLGCSTK